jgi:small subunit ribosomal protein S2
MKRFIFEERNGIHILDLQQTLSQLNKAGQALKDIVLQGGSVLFVGTKRQAKETIYREATRCGMFYINERWLGGTLTNNRTIRKSIGRLRELEAMSENGTFEKLPKKEVAHLLREKAKLHKHLDGIKEMDGLPAALFVVDTRREKIAIAEARKMRIPVVAMVDSTSDPDPIDYPIASNDDAIKSVSLLTGAMADCVVEAQNQLYKTQPEAAPGKAKPAPPRAEAGVAGQPEMAKKKPSRTAKAEDAPAGARDSSTLPDAAEQDGEHPHAPTPQTPSPSEADSTSEQLSKPGSSSGEATDPTDLDVKGS